MKPENTHTHTRTHTHTHPTHSQINVAGSRLDARLPDATTVFLSFPSSKLKPQVAASLVYRALLLPPLLSSPPPQAFANKRGGGVTPLGLLAARLVAFLSTASTLFRWRSCASDTATNAGWGSAR